MAQKMVDGEEYTSVLIKSGEDGSAIETITNGGSAVVSFLRPDNATAYTAGDIVAPSGAGYISFSGLTANIFFHFIVSRFCRNSFPHRAWRSYLSSK